MGHWGWISTPSYASPNSTLAKRPRLLQKNIPGAKLPPLGVNWDIIAPSRRGGVGERRALYRHPLTQTLPGAEQHDFAVRAVSPSLGLVLP